MMRGLDREGRERAMGSRRSRRRRQEGQEADQQGEGKRRGDLWVGEGIGRV
jgi:hypothetical protein